MMKRISFIVNPISGVGRQKIIEKLIDRYLDKTLFDYELCYTTKPKHATKLAIQAANKGFDIVVAVGGDGSVNEVAKGLLNTNTAMAIIPSGSGNGLARHLKIPMNLKKAMNIINQANETFIDTIQFNEEIAVNIAGLGFDAHIGWEFAKFGKRGLVSYVKVIIRELFNYKAHSFQLIIDGKTVDKIAYFISIANGSQWGNNATIAPLADIKDGILDVVIVKKFSFIKSFEIAYKLFKKTINTCNVVEIIKTKEMIIKQSSNIAHVDGEPIKVGNTISIKINPLSLKVIY
ncbi:MAG: YegS/Rv2252/BmrU family lipid kinase [Bacteroidia bacterium]